MGMLLWGAMRRRCLWRTCELYARDGRRGAGTLRRRRLLRDRLPAHAFEMFEGVEWSSPATLVQTNGQRAGRLTVAHHLYDVGSAQDLLRLQPDDNLRRTRSVFETR